MITIPTRRAVNAALAAALDRQAELRAEKGALQAEGRAIAATDLTEGRVSRAAELIDGKPAKPGNGGKERLDAIVTKLGDIETALEILGLRIDKEGSKASVIVCEKALPAYRQAVVAQCDAFVAAHPANKEQQEIIDSLEADGVLIGGLNYMSPFAIMGDYRDPYSHVALYLREAVAKGFYPASKLPPEFKL